MLVELHLPWISIDKIHSVIVTFSRYVPNFDTETRTGLMQQPSVLKISPVYTWDVLKFCVFNLYLSAYLLELFILSLCTKGFLAIIMFCKFLVHNLHEQCICSKDTS